MMCLCLKDSFDSNYRALQNMSGNQIMLILEMFRLLKSHISQDRLHDSNTWTLVFRSRRTAFSYLQDAEPCICPLLLITTKPLDLLRG